MRRVLGIIGATKCNLNCSYCFLHKNPAYVDEDLNIIKAFEDGSYLRNIKKTLNCLSIEYEDFDRFEIWGGEPSLHLIGAKDFFIKVLKDFPNIIEYRYSSNFLTDINNHLDFIKLIEEFGTRERYIVPLQISVDGPDWILEQTRHYKYETLRKNIDKFINELNKLKLEKVSVDILLKGTLPWNIFEQIISSRESMEEYYDFWKQEVEYYNSQILNGKVKVTANSAYSPSLVFPSSYTRDDGIKIVNAARIFDIYHMKEKYNLPENAILSMFGLKGETDPYLPRGCCGKYVHSLLFMPDGNLMACSNGFLDNNQKNLEWLKENDPQEYKEVLRTRPYINFYKQDGSLDYKAIKQQYLHMEKQWDYHSSFVTTTICSMIYELSHAGLISDIYIKNPKKIYPHALLIMEKHGCYFHSLRYSGNVYVPKRSYLSLVCNGLLEYYEERRK